MRKSINRIWKDDNDKAMSSQSFKGIHAVCEHMHDKWIVIKITHQPFKILNRVDISHYEQTGYTIEEAYSSILGFANYKENFNKKISA